MGFGTTSRPEGLGKGGSRPLVGSGASAVRRGDAGVSDAAESTMLSSTYWLGVWRPRSIWPGTIAVTDHDDDAALTRRVTAEAIVLAGGGAAILLQLADRRVALGVARHSSFSEAPLRRLTGTLAYVTAVIHGTEGDRALVRRAVERAHATVQGMEGAGPGPGSGARQAKLDYDANDPDAQLWVAATLFWAARAVHRRVFGRLSAQDELHLLRGFARLGTELRMHADAWPTTVTWFDTWFDGVVERAEVTEHALASFERLRHPSSPNAPWWLKLATPIVARVSLELLPPRLRRQYAPWWRRRDRFVAELFWAVTVPVYRALPRSVRTAVPGFILRGLRRRAMLSPER